MRTIEWTTAFKRDFKRIRATPRHQNIETLLPAVIERLSSDEPLEPRQHDHNLGGNWKDHRECHLKPDLLLIYTLPDPVTLRLVRMGSHSDLFS